MAGFLEFIDNTLGTHFNTPVYDPKKGRERLIKAIDTAAKQHADGNTKGPGRSWKVGNNDAISFSPKLNGNPVLIGGAETNYVSAARFQDFLKQLKVAVEAGELDKPIKAALEGEGALKRTRSKGGGTKVAADKPWTARKGYDTLTLNERQIIAANYRYGMNPDRTKIAEVGHKPDAPIVKR